ncbi:MAG: High-affinity zinc uptake system binding-protein ZnuA [Methanobacteriota archaeon]|nr:MAG: High-affinity zinc uptake system binding-protein ZnuA [Euryarchaeota archaeon]
MTYPKARPVMIAILLVATSLAGCLSTEEVADQPETEATLGTVYTSTWHVQDLVENIAGDRVNVELLAPSNVPVHDYEPTSTDLLYLRDADVFFYHGLGLETWVNTTLESMGDDAPEFVSIHTLPDGSIVLEYEAMLVADLCEHLNDGPFESSNLSQEGDLGEIHAEHVAHRLSFPMHEDDHEDDHGDDHDGHDEHDDHDVHAGHDHLVPEQTMEDPAGCPTDSVIQMYHMEEGHYVLEFEAEEMMSFDMSVLKMAGGHAHHDHHGHGDGPFEWAGIFSVSDSTHTWTMEKVDGSYADPSMRVVIIPTDTPTETTMHGLEGGVEALIEGDCKVVEDGETMTPIAADGSCFELHVGTGDISSFTMDTAGVSGFAAYTAHSPYEFEATQHYLKDSAGNDIEHIAEEGGGGHGDHGDHGDGHGDNHSDENGDNHSDDGHHDDDVNMTPELAIEEYDTDNNSHISWDEFWHSWIEDDHDGHADNESGHGHNESNHSGHHEEVSVCYNSEMNMVSGLDNETTCGSYVYMTNMSWGDTTFTGCYNTVSHAADPNMSVATCDAFMWMHQEEVNEINQLMAIFNQADEDNNSQLNMTELEHFIEALDAFEDSHDGHERHDGMFGAIAIHIEVEGDYGFALPHDVTMHIVPGGHDDHDDHSGHDDHSDHGDEHGADGFEWAGIFEMNDATHTWSMQKVGGDYADPSMWLVLIPTDTPTEDTMHSLESGVDALVDAGCTVVEDGESMSSIAASGTCFELHVGTGDDTTYTIDTSGFTGMAMYAQHVPTEFERDQHYLKDSAGTDIEPIAQEGAGAHDHGHGEEEDLGRFDPHSWLDPLSYRAQAALVRDVLIEAFPEGEADFTANAEAYMAELLTLHEEFSSGLAACESRSIAANHNAYAYLAERYDLQFVTVHGLDPEGEPSAAEIQEVVEKIEEEGITIFYVEEYTNEASVNSLVEQTKSGTMPDGVILKTLHTMEMPPKDTNDGYADLMKENLDNLLAGMEC